jgi:hypothetical protein
MKNAMPTRKSLGKISRFLQSEKKANPNSTQSRKNKRMNDVLPNSSKVGAGQVVVARRNLPTNTLHKRDHRSNTLIGVGF